MVDPLVVDSFRFQTKAAHSIGSELYGRLLEACSRDLEDNGPVARLVEGWQGHPILDSLPIRLLGAVHGLVLDGRAPELARHYPTAGGTPSWPEAGECFLKVVEAHAGELRPRLDAQIQTNEVRRCAALLPGLLEVAAETGLPLRLLEFGSSAGLNLNLDRYRYSLGPHTWGEAGSPVHIEAEWEGNAPPLAAPLRIASRQGCDISPVDVRDPERLRLLESFVWPDQPGRLERLRAAAALAHEHPPPLERITVGDFLARELREPREGVASVVFQSTVWWYIPEAERERVTRTVEEAGARASATAPLAWLRLEGVRIEHSDLSLRTWPDGRDRVLAHVHYHGESVRWRPAERAS